MALVLIVDDEPDTLLLLRLNLESAGYQTVLAADADTALERLRALPIDLVVLDIMMPVWDGWTVMEALRDAMSSPPAVIVSARAGPGDLDRAARMGAAGTLLIPFTPAELYRVVATALIPPAAVRS